MTGSPGRSEPGGGGDLWDVNGQADEGDSQEEEQRHRRDGHVSSGSENTKRYSQQGFGRRADNKVRLLQVRVGTGLGRSGVRPFNIAVWALGSWKRIWSRVVLD